MALPLQRRQQPLSQWFGWAGVVFVVLWTALAGLRSQELLGLLVREPVMVAIVPTEDVDAIEGAVPFAWVALVLLAGVKRWAPPRSASAFVQLGAIALLSWLLTSFANTFWDWHYDRWLLQVVKTFHDGVGVLRFAVIACRGALAREKCGCWGRSPWRPASSTSRPRSSSPASGGAVA
jgi:hypothetical protein